MSSFYITKEGLYKLEEELESLKIDFDQVSKLVGESGKLGDLRENAEYHSAKQRQNEIMNRIRYLENGKSNAIIVENYYENNNQIIKFGAIVTIKDLSDGKIHNFKILGEYESNPNKSIISINSPIGKGLIGKKIGDFVLITTPSKKTEYEIIEIKYNIS